jgi:2-C-methyl-D-erythritol 2,4-cyclodiphosphate synthase
MYRVGIGYDAHRLVEGRKLILGGVEIPYSKGLLGHSDADVLVHAVCDSILGALSLGDIGEHFPDSNPEFKGISSLLLLKRVAELVRERGYEVVNVDCVLVAQRPKLKPFKRKMEENIASALGISPSQVSVKATMTEGLGFEGREEGISAKAVALLKRLNGGS